MKMSKIDISKFAVSKKNKKIKTCKTVLSIKAYAHPISPTYTRIQSYIISPNGSPSFPAPCWMDATVGQ